MSAFYFGSSERPLFGFYHQPTSRPVRPDGVVLCSPLGTEYLRTHRTLKQLAGRLSESGFHVLRFDYSGTGDSGGEGADATLAEWRSDVETAADELKAMAAVDRVTLIGVRLGAALAASVAGARDDLEDVVLWDPVVRGRPYLEELLDPDGSNGSEAPPPTRDDAVVGVEGFPLGIRLREELAGLDLTTLDSLPARRALLVVSEERDEFGALLDHLDDLGPEVTKRHRPGSEGWENPGRMGTVVLVPAIVGTIVDFMEERG